MRPPLLPLIPFRIVPRFTQALGRAARDRVNSDYGSRSGVKRRVLECPQCGGHDLYYETGLVAGYRYHCKDCDYIGPLVIERDVE